MMDRTREQTDKTLAKMERRIKSVYSENSDLKRVKKKYDQYMARVQERTRTAYNAFVHETDTNKRAELKKAYADEIRAYTVESKEYQGLVDEMTDAIAKANEQALAISNSEMFKIYAMNYNQVADDCRKAGIKVNG